MPISSLIVRTAPESTGDVADSIQAMSGASVSHIQDDDIVVLTETDSTYMDKALWDAIEQVKGVQTVELIYHNFEDAKETTE